MSLFDQGQNAGGWAQALQVVGAAVFVVVCWVARIHFQLAGLLDWQRNKSIDRSEHEDLRKRVDNVEADVTEVAKSLTDIKVQLARIPEQLGAHKELMGCQFETLSHKLNGVRQLVEGYIGERPARRRSPPS